MTDSERKAAQYAAKIASEILEQVGDDGEKLFSITNNYPRGAKAVWLGFNMAAGAIIAGCIFAAFVGLIEKVFT